MDEAIEVKLCECGCGLPAPIAKRTRCDLGHAKGQPIRFVNGHSRRTITLASAQRPCECGCGQLTSIASQSNMKLGRTKGQPMRFIQGHHNKVRHKRSIAERFWKKVEVREKQDCWEWQACLDNRGYGQIGTAGDKHTRAHRVSWELHNGTIPPGMNVLHKCDNPACVNPTHLFLGTQNDNVQDMDAKNRRVNAQPKGESHGMSKLTETQVLAMRHRHASGEKIVALAMEYGVRYDTVWKIIKNRSWKHVADQSETDHVE